MSSPVETTEKSLHYYVINLPQSEKRREHMREVLGPLFSPPIRFFTAVEGAKLSPAEKSAACVDMDLSDTELGCALSHQGVYKAMIQANEEYAFVFEDDIDRGAMTTKEVLASCHDFVLTRSRPTVITLHRQGPPLERVGTVGADIPVYHACRGAGAYAYILNLAAAKTLIKINTPVRFEADMWVLFDRAKLIDAYFLGEMLFSPGSMPSTIEGAGKRANDSRDHQRRKTQFLRQHGYTFTDLLHSRLAPRYYAVLRALRLIK